MPNANSISIVPEMIDPPLPLGAPDAGRRYESIRLIGEGGSANITLCRDVMVRRRLVMKKLKRNKLGDRRFVDGITREARIQALLDIDGVPQVLDLDRDRLGCPFYMMNFIDGCDLRTVLAALNRGDETMAEEFPLPRLINVIGDVASILAIAHRRGVIHNDIKPENIMVDAAGQTWLIDWGSSRLEQSPDPVSGPVFTERRHFIGSPTYASPETITGKKIDCRSDLYSLGAVLYDMLALTTMIQATTFNTAVQAVLAGQHAHPSEVGLRDEVPKYLEELCMRCVSLDPNDRVSTAGELLAELVS